MFDTIILLAGTAEQVALPPVLRGHNPLLTVISAGTSADLAALHADVLERARLIAFVTPEIVEHSRSARLRRLQFPPRSAQLSRMSAGAFCALRAGNGVQCDGSCHGRTGRYGSDHRRRAVSDSGRHFRAWSGGLGLRPPRAIILAHGKIAGDGSEGAANASDQMGRQKVFPPRLSSDLRHSSRHSQG